MSGDPDIEHDLGALGAAVSGALAAPWYVTRQMRPLTSSVMYIDPSGAIATAIGR